MLILGLGFDMRCLRGLRELLNVGLVPTLCKAVEYGSGDEERDSDLVKRARYNRDEFKKLLADDVIEKIQIRTVSSSGRYIGGNLIVDAFTDTSAYTGFSDVAVDISALPPGLYFPLIGALLRQAERVGFNLHVLVSDNASLDAKIVPEGGDRAETVRGFEAGLDRAAIPRPLPIWAPVLGEQAAPQLRTIGSYKEWRLIHPVLPFPARNPRRADELIVEYHDLIFDEWQVEPQDLIYADEQNPFDVYQALSNMADSVRESLDPLGTPQIIVSAHSSKLLSLGVLLAAYEKHLGVVHVPPTGYSMNSDLPLEDLGGNLFEIWLTGEPYAVP